MAPTIVPPAARSTPPPSSGHSSSCSDADSVSGPIIVSSDDGSDADSGSGPILSSSGGSTPGPIVLSSDEDEPARKKSRRENWPFCDQVKILIALAAHRQAGEGLPSERALFGELQHQLRRERFTARDLYKKVAHLRDRYLDELYRPSAARRRPLNKTLFDLSRKAWPDFQPQVEVVHISSSSSSSSSSSAASS